MTVIRELLAVRGLRDNTTEAFRRALILAAEDVPMHPDHLSSVISFETSGTFRANIRNPRSGFVGLIQFGPRAAKMLGTSTDRLASMSPVQQLAYVVSYYQRVAGTRPVVTLEDAYLAVFAGRIGLGPDAPLYKAPSKAYEQNRELDRDGDGVITAGEATRFVRAIYAAALKEAPIPVSMSPLDPSPTLPPSC